MPSLFDLVLRAAPIAAQGVSAYRQGEDIAEERARKAQQDKEERDRAERHARLQEAILQLRRQQAEQELEPSIALNQGGVSLRVPDTPEGRSRAKARLQEFAPAAEEPTITALGRRFPDTPEGRQEAIAWRRQNERPRTSEGSGSTGGLTRSERRRRALAAVDRMLDSGTIAPKIYAEIENNEELRGTLSRDEILNRSVEFRRRGLAQLKRQIENDLSLSEEERAALLARIPANIR